MRYRSNNYNLAYAIRETVPPRRFAALVRNLPQRHELSHARKNLIEPNHNFGSPNSVLFERHKLDEADHYALFPRKLPKVNDLIFIKSAQQYAVDLYRTKPRPPRRAHTRQHALIPIRHTRDASK